MRYSPQIFFRAPQDPPKEPGWYYAIPKLRLEHDKVEPHRLCKGGVATGNAGWDPKQYEWFGPVPEVKEASNG